MSIIITCPNCGRNLVKYDEKAHFRRYGSPIKRCSKCGSIYADPRFHEIAIEGIPSGTFGLLQFIVIIIIGAFLFYRGINLFGAKTVSALAGIQWLMPILLVVVGLVMAIGGIIEIVSILAGIKANKFDKLAMESDERLRNKKYARKLSDLGYDVPEMYL